MSLNPPPAVGPGCLSQSALPPLGSPPPGLFDCSWPLFNAGKRESAVWPNLAPPLVLAPRPFWLNLPRPTTQRHVFVPRETVGRPSSAARKTWARASQFLRVPFYRPGPAGSHKIICCLTAGDEWRRMGGG